MVLHNAAAMPVTFKGKRAIKVTAAPGIDPGAETLAIVSNVEFSNGAIELDLAGEPAQAVASGARGFAGVAFRVQPDRAAYDCFYLRPTNGRAGDRERRNHAAQYISRPRFTWSKLRQETPSRYESYVDIQAAE